MTASRTVVALTLAGSVVLSTSRLGAQANGAPKPLVEVDVGGLGMTRVHSTHIRTDGVAAIVGSGRTLAVLLEPDGRVRQSIPAQLVGSVRGIPRSGLVADDLWVMVPLAAELLVFDRSGSIARRVRTDLTPVLPNGEEAPIVQPGGMMGPIPLGLLPADDLILQVMSPEQYPAPESWGREVGATAGQLRVDSKGIIRSFIGWLPGDSRCRFGGSRLPFCRARIDARSSDASLFAAVEVEQSPVGDSIEVHIAMRDATGGIVYDTRERMEGSPLEQGALDSAMSRIVSSPRHASLPAERLDSLLEAYRPRFLPAVEEAMIGNDGRLWLRMQDRDASVRYRVIGRDGRSAKTLVFPQDVRVLGADASRAWALRAADGQRGIVVFSL